jgi:hypothetical protein
MNCAEESQLVHPDSNAADDQIEKRHPHISTGIPLKICKDEEKEGAAYESCGRDRNRGNIRNA